MDDSEEFLGFNIDIMMIIHTVNKYRRFTDGGEIQIRILGGLDKNK